jgi:hypothetical protein
MTTTVPEPQCAGHPHIVAVALGDHDHAGQIAVVIEQAMELDRALGAPNLGPVEQRRAQIDHSGVQADQPVLEQELPPPGDLRLTAPSSSWNTAR